MMKNLPFKSIQPTLDFYVIPTVNVIAADSSGLLCSSSPNGNLQDTETGFGVNVKVMGQPGCVVLYPDDYFGDKVQDGDISAFDTVAEYESALEAGIVILPAAGYRSVSSVIDAGSYFAYWSRDSFSSTSAYCLELEGTKFIDGHRYKYYGLPVRLVTESW